MKDKGCAYCNFESCVLNARASEDRTELLMLSIQRDDEVGKWELCTTYDDVNGATVNVAREIIFCPICGRKLPPIFPDCDVEKSDWIEFEDIDDFLTSKMAYEKDFSQYR